MDGPSIHQHGDARYQRLAGRISYAIAHHLFHGVRAFPQAALWDVVEGRMLIYVRKEQMPADVKRRCPARHYIMTDDKMRILAAMKRIRGDGALGVHSKTYADNPIALHSRAMNMLYEGLKENATIVVVPGTAVETMQLSRPCRVDVFGHGTRPRARKRRERKQTQETRVR